MASFDQFTRPLPIATWLDILRDYEHTLPTHLLPEAYNRGVAFQEWLLTHYSPLDRFTSEEFHAIMQDYLNGPAPDTTASQADAATGLPLPADYAPPTSNTDFFLHLLVRAIAVAIFTFIAYSCATTGA